ncbi:MAG: hypothetical protein FJW39_34605 [Acidobacteria bacterium]|nr:hypothetical protein [Acidobacteriota bacterium]
MNSIGVKPVLVLYDPRRPAHSFKRRRVVDLGWIKIVVKFEVRRVWTMDPTEIIRRKRTHMLPAVMAMDSTQAQIREASLMIESVDREAERRRLFQEAVTFAAVRYNEAEIEKMLGRVKANMLPPMEVVRRTQIGQRIEKIGMFKGHQKGRHEGRVEALRDSIRSVLRHRFPEFQVPVEGLPDDEEALTALMNTALTARDAGQVASALRPAG